MSQTMIDEEWISSMTALLKSVDNDNIQSYSLSTVPERLKESNDMDPVKNYEDDVYMPRVVSIGPRFKGAREELLLMEEVKLRCMSSLIHRAGIAGDADTDTYVDKCCRLIWDLDAEVRASYVADMNHIKTPDLAKIMLVDGCFLLELLVVSKVSTLNDDQLLCRLKSPPLAPQLLLNEDVLSDLILFENQIPMYVLLRLFDTLFEGYHTDRDIIIIILALAIFGFSLPHRGRSYIVPDHILDVVTFFVNKESTPQSIANHVVDIPRWNLKLKLSASRLRAAGIPIKVAPSCGVSCFTFLWNCFGGILPTSSTATTWLVNVSPSEETVIKGLVGLDFKFQNGKLEIRQLHIKKTTKAMWRNIIASEHHQKRKKRKYPNGKLTSAAWIFDGLICCPADVKLLKDKNIIVDHTEMSEELEAFFHSVSFGIDHGIVDSKYVNLVADLNIYSRAFSFLRMWRAFCQQMTKTFYHFVLSFVAFLTLVQTLYAILAYHHPPK